MQNVERAYEKLLDRLDNILDLADIASKNCEFGECLTVEELCIIVDDMLTEITSEAWRMKSALREMSQEAINSATTQAT